MSHKQNKAYVLPHTHWDREWRYPIWQSRVLLLRFMEQLLHILDTDAEYRCFLLDGQVAPIEDYLEIMPQHREKVTQYIREGRIAIGPWYTLPDLYPVDGECLVRNLLAGTQSARALGGCLNVGYNSFGWGQTAQFPQLYQGFGIDFIVCAKKVSEERAPESEFMWEAPDGTAVLTTRLGEHARANFYFHTYLYAKYGINCMSSEFRYSPPKSGMAIHNASPDYMDEDFLVVEPKLDYSADWLCESFADAWQATDATALKEHRLLLSGTDFSTPQPQISAMLKDLNERIPDVAFVHARLEEYAQAAHEHLDKTKLRTIRGELRDGPACDCSGNALSSRIYLKMLNKQAENALLRFAEPLSCALWKLGEEYPTGLLAKAWDYMLKAHPHDSINGVTQDKTANDVEYRLAQAIEIGQVVTSDGVANLAKRLDLSRFDEDATLLLVYNPNPWPVREVGKVNIVTPAAESVWSLEARDLDGTPLQIQEIARDEKAYPAHDSQARPWPLLSHRHLCYMDFGKIPAMGYKVIEVVKGKRFGPDAFYWLPMRRATPGSLLVGDTVLENEHLRAEVNPDGTLRLTHKATGRIYDKLHSFEDSGDVGNYWAYYPPYHNQTHTTKGGRARIWSEDSGALSATLAVEYTMTLPAYGEESVYGVRGKGRRSEETVDLKILSRFTLRRGAKRLDIHTELVNNAENHRLRVAFPTGIQADFVDAAGHFTMDRRPRRIQPAEDGTYWPEMQTQPMQQFVDVHDDENGLALLHNCFTEYECAKDEASTLYVTLFRAMGNMIVTWWEAVGQFADQKGSQLQRKMAFDYALYPHEVSRETGEMYREAAQHNAQLACYQLCGNHSGDLPLSQSFFSVSNPNLVLSACKRSESGESLILRLYNPTEDVQSGEICTAGFPMTGAWRCGLNEERQEELAAEAHRLCVTLEAQKILTIEIE